MTATEWDAIVEKWERCRKVLGTDGFNEIINALREGRRLSRTQGEVARRALVVIENPSSDTIQAEIAFIREAAQREASKP